MLNIHPSLLPAFPGLDTHARALAAGVKLHGCTVHLVTQAMDEGPILAQAAVPVLPGDTAETLAARVLVQEHRIYPMALRCLLQAPGARLRRAMRRWSIAVTGIANAQPILRRNAPRDTLHRESSRRMGRAAAKPISPPQHQQCARWPEGKSDRIKRRHARESRHPARASRNGGSWASRLRGNDSLKKPSVALCDAPWPRGCPVTCPAARCN